MKKTIKWPAIVLSAADCEIVYALGAGVAVAVSDAKDNAGVYTSIEMFGKLLGKEGKASEIVDGMKKAFADIESNKLDVEKAVYFEVSPLERG